MKNTTAQNRNSVSALLIVNPRTSVEELFLVEVSPRGKRQEESQGADSNLPLSYKRAAELMRRHGLEKLDVHITGRRMTRLTIEAAQVQRFAAAA